MQNKKSTAIIPKRRALLYAQWLEHFASWQVSGQTKQAYCLSNNLSFDAFKKQFSRSRQTTKRVQQRPSEHFIPVQLIDVPISQAIEFIFTSGVVMKIASSAPLHSVLKSLEAYL